MLPCVCVTPLGQCAQEAKAGLPPMFLKPSLMDSLTVRGLHPFIIPGTDVVSSVMVHKPRALQRGPVLHGAGVTKRERSLHWSKIPGCCKMA